MPRSSVHGPDGRPARQRAQEAGVAEQLVGRLEFQAGMDREERDEAIRRERQRLEQEQPGARLRERVLVGAGGRNVVEWYRDA